MKIMAFDLATKTGVAIGDAAGRPLAHTESLGSPGQPHGERFAQCMRMVKRLVTQHAPDLVVIEQPIASGPKGSADRIMLAAGLRASVFGICHAIGVPYREHSVLSVRKYFIGDASKPRAEAKAAVLVRCRQLGWSATNDNEGDALALWDYTRANLRIADTPVPGGLFERR